MLTHSLRSRILVALVLLAMVPLIIAAGQGYHCAHEAVTDVVMQDLRATAARQSKVLEDWYVQRQDALAAFARSPLLAKAMASAAGAESETAPPASDLLNLFDATGAYFDALTLYDSKWAALASRETSTHPDGVALPPDVQRQLATTDEPVLGAIHAHEDGELGVHVGMPVIGEAGERLGYLAAFLNVSQGFQAILTSHQAPGQDGSLYVVSEDGEIRVASSPDRLSAPATLPPADPVETNHGHAAALFHGDAPPVLAAAAPLPFAGWQVIAETDRAVALAWLDVLLSRALVTALVTLGVLVLASIWISGWLGRPLNALARVADRIGSGYTEERLAAMKLNELERVRRSFNHMLDELETQQEQLVRATTLAAIGELTSSIVHEMRNPLSSIKMNLQALGKSVDGDAVSEELADIGSEQVQRMERMLNDLLQYGRPLTLEKSPLRFGDVAAAARTVMEAQAAKKQAQITIDDRLHGAVLNADKEHLSRALCNLIGNGLDAIEPGGEVTVRCRVAPNRPMMAEVAVEDTGPGISPELQQRLFRPFVTTKSQGTGLGLVNVKKVVEMHGGEVKAENRAEGGARFVLLLPLARADVATAV